MTAPRANLAVDGARLWDSLMEMATIGPGIAGGNDRQALTDADGEARRLFARWCAALGMMRFLSLTIASTIWMVPSAGA